MEPVFEHKTNRGHAPRVLMIDDHELLLPKYAEGLRRYGIDPVSAHFAEYPTRTRGLLSFLNVEAIARYAIHPEHRIDAVLTDNDSVEGREFGRELAKRLSALHYQKPVFMFTGGYSEEFDDMMRDIGVRKVFRKPCETSSPLFRDIATAIHSAVEEKPRTIISGICVNHEPVIVVIDDDPRLLQGYCERFTQEGWRAIPLWVPQPDDEEYCTQGRVNHAVVQERQAALKYKNPQESNLCGVIDGFNYAATTREQVRALLDEIKPDCVLSDFLMRSPDDARSAGGLMGSDIVALMQARAKELGTATPLAVHSSMFNPQHKLTFEEQYAADRQGYFLTPKHKDFAIDRIAHYFERQLAGPSSHAL